MNEPHGRQPDGRVCNPSTRTSLKRTALAIVEKSNADIARTVDNRLAPGMVLEV